MKDELNKGSILLVEDDGIIVLHLKSILQRAGFKIARTCSNVEQAREFLHSGPAMDAAVLDINLGDHGNAYPIADHLRSLGIPFLFVTGYGNQDAIPMQYQDIARFEKPVEEQLLCSKLASLIGVR